MIYRKKMNKTTYLLETINTTYSFNSKQQNL